MDDQDKLGKTAPKPSSPFLNGVLVGAALGAAAFFILGTKEGKQSRKKLAAKTKKILGHVENIIDELEEKGHDIREELHEKGDVIKDELETVGKIINKQKKATEKKIGKLEKQIVPVIEETAKIVRKTGKKFFSRKGKILKKKK